MENQLAEMRKQLSKQRIYTWLLTACLGFVFFSSFRNNNQFDIIRAHGLVIVDSGGHERILLGAPIPYAANRVRTNLKRVQEIWGKNMQPKYMEWYKSYNNTANGMIILDEKGFDRIALGDPTPDPNIGKRIGPATGMLINDELGFERSGYSLLNVDGQNRMVLGLDRKGGTEGVTLSIMEDETAGLGVSHENKFLFLGNSPKDGLPMPMKKDLFGLGVSDSSKLKYAINPLKLPG